jgi:hypothetical protein
MTPHYILFKGKNLWDSWCKDGPVGCVYNTSESGWMEPPHFLEWLRRVFIPFASKIPGPKLLTLDNHISRFSVETIDLAKANAITLFGLPSKSSHLTQPIDRAVAGPVKKAWKPVVKEHFERSGFRTIDKENFAMLFSKLDKLAFFRRHVVAGFECTGIYPFNRHAIDPKLLKPSEPWSGASNGGESNFHVRATGAEIDDGSDDGDDGSDENDDGSDENDDGSDDSDDGSDGNGGGSNGNGAGSNGNGGGSNGNGAGSDGHGAGSDGHGGGSDGHGGGSNGNGAGSNGHGGGSNGNGGGSNGNGAGSNGNGGGSNGNGAGSNGNDDGSDENGDDDPEYRPEDETESSSSEDSEDLDDDDKLLISANKPSTSRNAATATPIAAQNAVLSYLQKTMDAKKSSKTPRISLKRNFAQALTDDEVRTQLVDREAAVKKKKEEQVLRKANLDAKKQADKEKKEAAQKERDLKRIRAEREKSEKALQRASQIRNKAFLSCYSCFIDKEDHEKKRGWLFCTDCHLWCCPDCLPVNSIKRTYVCNNCATGQLINNAIEL